MPDNLSLFIIARANRGVTCYERGRRRHCVSISKDHGRSVVGSSGSELGPSGRGRLRSGKDLREVEILEWWKAATDRVYLRDEGELWDGRVFGWILGVRGLLDGSSW